ncbi:hypothetical protein HO173_011713 [Letharia columbiana]|uniref:Uncharacterized protein n=1 Tax=Letharia columbiana TaxID=112416 RepID=A0A8H6FHZ9_9LECA|nr:uncharacterized protein HO173_011713 [Letharia columbiana]KAF6228694.1 hypothetical protein HO173_011713 [Letharia columbiana]
MEDFIERVGQSYLERKAFAAPQQLENFAKKQFTGGDEKEAEAKKSTGKKATEEEEEGEDEEERTTNKKGIGKRAGQTSSGSLQKDKEIARLKKQLAQSKLENAKAPHEKSASGLKKLGVSRASNGQKAFTSKAAGGNKESTKSAALGAVAAVGGRHEEKKSKSGEKEARGSTLAKEAHIVEASPTKRRTSASQYHGHDGGGKSEHGAGSKSEHGGHAKSTTPHAAAASDSKRRPSAASQSEHGSTAKRIAPAPVHKHPPAHAERLGGARAVVESRRPKRREERERDLYAVEVVEELPRGTRKDAGGVVEVESSKGKTLYRVG